MYYSELAEELALPEVPPHYRAHVKARSFPPSLGVAFQLAGKDGYLDVAEARVRRQLLLDLPPQITEVAVPVVTFYPG